MQMCKEKIIQPVFNNILYHKMPPVLRKKNCKGSQITVRLGHFINVFKNLVYACIEMILKAQHQVFIKSIVEIVLYNFFPEICTAAFITQNIPETGTVFYNFFSVVIARIGTGSKN